LLNVGRREVDRCTAARPIVTAVRDGSRDAVAALLHRRVWQSNDDNDRIAAGTVYLDFHFIRVHAVNGGRGNFSQHRSGRLAENRCAEKRQISLESEIPLVPKMWSNVQGLHRPVFDTRDSKTPAKKIEQETSTQCHRFEYLTLLNTS